MLHYCVDFLWVHAKCSLLYSCVWMGWWWDGWHFTHLSQAPKKWLLIQCLAEAQNLPKNKSSTSTSKCPCRTSHYIAELLQIRSTNGVPNGGTPVPHSWLLTRVCLHLSQQTTYIVPFKTRKLAQLQAMSMFICSS